MYMRLLTDKKFGIEENILATKIMPAMLPVVVNPNLAIDEVNKFSNNDSIQHSKDDFSF